MASEPRAPLPPPFSRPASDFSPGRARGRRFEPPRASARPLWVVAPWAPRAIELTTPAPHFLLHQARFHVGDTLWLTPLLRAVRQRFGAARATVVGPPIAVEILGGNPNVAEVLVYPEDGGLRERQAVLLALAESLPEVALFAFARRPESRWLARAAAEMGVAHRINLEYFDPALDSRSVGERVTHEGWFQWGSMPSPRMLLHALAPLAGDPTAGPELEATDRRLELPISERSRRGAGEVLAAHGVVGPFVLLAPGGQSSQRWPAERFSELAERLANELALHVLIEGAPEEEPLLRQVAERARSPRVAASQDPLGVFAALLERCRLLVANDSAPIHLAEAVAAPTLYFAQREKLVHSHPAGELCWALYDDVDNDLRRISVEQVMAALGEMGLGDRCLSPAS